MSAKMSGAEDDDLKFLRAAASRLSDLEKLLHRIMRMPKHDASAIRHQVREIDMFGIFALLEPFQEDPQLLDSHLKVFVPPLVAAYLDSIRTISRPKRKKGFVPLSHAICQILNLFCKVRGEKVVKGFLNNEPRYLEPILNEFETGANYTTVDDEPLPQSIVPWTERYVLLLWLSHLLLAPFPLASMSVPQSSEEASAALGIDLPPEVPGIALRVLTKCIDALKSASKERGAAANLLVRLCIRPDMQQLGLLNALVNWSLDFFAKIFEGSADIHQCLGVLTFLSGLVTSATNEEIGPFLSAIYRVCQNIVCEATLAFVNSSAVARKLVIKTFRNIVIHCLKAVEAPFGLDATIALEEVIEFLLEALADGDTPVRYAASKALSIVTMKLEDEMAGEVVEAILGSLNENVYWQGSQRNLSAVDPLRWHGLTLTLSHLLYQRAVSTSQLPEILNALLLALAFEQRSATGGSIGTNVRDAACFGIWAVSRRYATKELLAVETSSVRASEHQTFLSILQVLAIELVVVSCLDPAGNIRRGSSAALQELIGRHPNTVEQGIPLVQVIDFHAVGLRERGMCAVSLKAAELHRMYWEALFENLLSWRGTGSLDSTSRLHAARAIGLLSTDQQPTVVRKMADRICSQLSALKAREVEERQGLVSALAALVDQANSLNQMKGSGEAGDEKHVHLTCLWGLLKVELDLEEKSFTSPALRPELTASSICSLLGALSEVSYADMKHLDPAIIPTQDMIRLFNLCLGRHADSVIEAIPRTTHAILKLLSAVSHSNKDEAVSGWLSKLENEASYNGLRWSGFAIALGAAYSSVGMVDNNSDATTTQMRIVEVLTFRCTSAVAIEPRSVALRAIDVLLKGCGSQVSPSALAPNIKDQIAKALRIALNDYTVTERGDVGSLVRLEALSTIGTAWECGILDGSSYEEDLHADVIRLSLEKLDKVRLRAAHVLGKGTWLQSRGVVYNVEDGTSSYAYFANTLALLQLAGDRSIREAICLGFVTSAGMGSESVVQNSRAALLDTADAWTIATAEGEELSFSLVDFANCLLDILKTNLEIERVLLPLLEVFAFLFDMQVLQRLSSTPFNFRTLLSYTQKAHFKSTHMQKLHLALDVYRGLGTIPATRADTITKVTSMLLHPFPKIRITAAETLWMLTKEEGLKRQDWSLPSKILRPIVDGLKDSVANTAKD
ncbi:hypothetical protein K458DRAFT_342479 [Lentithecium fluviatile CBS 122367]|uniref:Uncharacterized protein n=1 Tax=Lentithecium fluviatile CBS 122367 TaxID=1168545 RepID=A0A6G1IVJ2_9PLEO|nr:hypothetical protein K458DRAFT_342479 [Lentithecium fluviatile CBS 122367]